MPEQPPTDELRSVLQELDSLEARRAALMRRLRALVGAPVGGKDRPLLHMSKKQFDQICGRRLG